MTDGSDRRAILQSFDGALAREVHNLAQRPDLLWQQIHNRLQWESDPTRSIIDAERDRQNVFGPSAWIRTRIPPPESKALVRTLTGHTDWVKRCAVGPCGRYVVSAAGASLKVWDPASGIELCTLAGHTREVNDCVVSPDGSFVVSASGDETLRVWDPTTGESLRILAGHTERVNACAISPDGSYVVSASSDSTLRVWDPTTGRALAMLGDLRRWHEPSGHELSTRGHKKEVLSCAVSPDGAYVVSGSADQTVKLWSPSGAELGTLEGFAGNFARGRKELEQALAMQPDNYVALTGLGVLELKSGHEEAALDALLRASLIEPRYARAHLYLAAAYYQIGRDEAAMAPHLSEPRELYRGRAAVNAAATVPRPPVRQVFQLDHA